MDIGILDYSTIKYKSAHHKVTYLTKFGYCEMSPNSLLNCKIADSINSAKDKTDYIKKVIIYERGDEFDLSNVKYVNNNTPIKIRCKEHGVFEVMPSNFIGCKSHRGCPKCSREATTKSAKDNPIGWSHENWSKASKISKYFDNYKVYILECHNDEEHFYKIGRTFLKTDRRFRSHTLPYNYKILYEFIDEDAKYICELENELKSTNKHNKYVPNIIFDGMYECFSKIDNIPFQV